MRWAKSTRAGRDAGWPLSTLYHSIIRGDFAKTDCSQKRIFRHISFIHDYQYHSIIGTICLKSIFGLCLAVGCFLNFFLYKNQYFGPEVFHMLWMIGDFLGSIHDATSEQISRNTRILLRDEDKISLKRYINTSSKRNLNAAQSWIEGERIDRASPVGVRLPWK